MSCVRLNYVKCSGFGFWVTNGFLLGLPLLLLGAHQFLDTHNAFLVLHRLLFVPQAVFALDSRLLKQLLGVQ